MKANTKLAIAILSAGWLGPVFLSAMALQGYVRFELIPEVTGHPFLSPFPHLEASMCLLAIGCSWLTGVIICWSFFFLRTGWGLNETSSTIIVPAARPGNSGTVESPASIS